jgi:hypothetical protein
MGVKIHIFLELASWKKVLQYQFDTRHRDVAKNDIMDKKT